MLNKDGTPRMPRTRDDIRTNFGFFYLAMHPTYGWTYYQQEILAPIYDAIVAGHPMYKRVFVNMPFRHGKTEAGTLALIPYYFGHHPDHTVILLAYQQKIAQSFGGMIRDLMRTPDYLELFPESTLTKSSRASDQFKLNAGGRFFAGGFDTGVVGRGAQLLCIDDPHKNAQEVRSEVEMAHLRSIWTNVADTRLEPPASDLNWEPAIIGNTTRWATSDFVGWRIDKDGAFDHFTGEDYRDAATVNPS